MDFSSAYQSRRSNVVSNRGMVASSQPLATMAGINILQAGGNAADAAIAVASTLAVVEPLSTGIGGDCFALYWDAAQKKVFALNGSGPAAKKSNLDALIQAGYLDYPLYSGHAVSVPGTASGWESMLSRFGTMPLAEVLKAAIGYAEAGFPVSELISLGWHKLARSFIRGYDESDQPLHLRHTGPVQASGYEMLLDGRAPEFGDLMKLPTLAETLRGIAADGARYIYQGKFAEECARHVQRYDGWLEKEDFFDFSAEWVEPIFCNYRGYQLFECPPNGQGLAALIAARLAEGFDLAGMEKIARTHVMIECMRQGLADALAWVGDPHQTAVPVDDLISDQYINQKRGLIRQTHAQASLSTGLTKVGQDTVYLSVVDGEGNACSFINSLFHGGGTCLVVPGTGVFLQNRASSFSLDPNHPNVLKGGKRPFHTIIPGMIIKDDALFASFGVMGGVMQAQGHFQMLANLVDHKMSPQMALDATRWRLQVDGGGVGANDPGGVVMVEEGFSFSDIAALNRLGHKTQLMDGFQRNQFGGGQIITRDNDSGVLIGGSDSRKDGCAIGL